MRIFEFIINEEDNELGMKAISLVDRPAMESEFIAFNKQEKHTFIKFQDDKKYIVAGLALIPNKLIYRVDESTGEEYMGYFSEATIESIMNKFMREATEGTTQNVNLQHNEADKLQAHLVESFILRTPEMVQAVKAMGIEDAVEGSWYVAYKFDDKQAYDSAVNSGLATGFSIEIALQRELKLSKNNIKNNDKIMTKIKSFIDKFKTMLNEMENNLEDVKVPEVEDKVLRIGEIGQPVLWIGVDEAGAEVTEPALEGSYILEDGRTIVVDAMGNLLEIKEAGTEVAPIPEEEMTKEEKPVEVPLAEAPAEEEVPAVSGDTKPAEEEPMVDVTLKTLGELVDVQKAGDYIIKCTVLDGKIVSATVEAEQVLVKEAEFTALKAENEEMKDRLAKLKVKPAFVAFDTYQDKSANVEDKKTLNNLEYHLKKLGLNK
jgi:hypothetical protein